MNTPGDMEERFKDLELRFMEQQEWIEALNKELTQNNAAFDLMKARVQRLESTLENVLKVLDRPIDEKPPHY